MYYMRTSFVEGLYFERWCLTGAKSLLATASIEPVLVYIKSVQL